MQPYLNPVIPKEVFLNKFYIIFQNSNWKGLTVIDPFNTPEAVVEVYVDGVPSIGHVVSTTLSHFTLLKVVHCSNLTYHNIIIYK